MFKIKIKNSYLVAFVIILTLVFLFIYNLYQKKDIKYSDNKLIANSEALFDLNFGNNKLTKFKKVEVDLDLFGFVKSKNFDNFNAFQSLFNYYDGKNVELVMPSGNYGVSFNKTPKFFLNNKGASHAGIKIPSNVHFNGNNLNLYVLENLSARTHVFTNSDWEKGNSNIVIRNINIFTNGRGIKKKGTDYRINGISLIRTKNSTIDKVSIIDGYGYGIWLWSSSNNTIINSYVSEFEDGIELARESQYNLIFNNRVEMLRSKDSSKWGNSLLIAFRYANNNYFLSNSLINNRGTAIKTISTYGAGNKNIFEKNTIKSGQYGIGIILNGVGNIVKDNLILVEQEPAIALPKFYIDVEDTSIINNLIYSNNYKKDLPKFSYGNSTIKIGKKFKNLKIKNNVIYYKYGSSINKNYKFDGKNVIKKIRNPISFRSLIN